MKIVKKIPMNYTIIYIDDNGKYSAYKRFSSEEWYDVKKNRLVSDQERLENLEEVYSESEK
jgi:hypothetical protein